MRPREDELIDPEIAEQLDAIDATLAGEPVAPRFAELAELALLVSVVRPEAMRPEFAAELDRRVEERFGSAPAGAPAVPSRGRSRRWGWSSWSLAPVAGVVAAAALAVVVVVATGGGGSTSAPRGAVAVSQAAAAAPVHASAGLKVGAVNGSLVIKAPARPASRGNDLHGLAKSVPATTTPAASAPPVLPAIPAAPSVSEQHAGAGAGTGGGSSSAASAPGASFAPAPVPNGRKAIQSSILSLGARPNRIDAVAQEVFNEVGAVNGIVDSSNVSSSGGLGAGAEFQLRIPSPALAQALTDLSRLRYAHVISRNDSTRDVNSPYLSTQRRIAAAQATLARLRTQLAAATATTTIDTLKAEIANEQGTLGRAQAGLRSLNRQVDYSRVSVSIQATGPVVQPPSGGGGFGLHRAGHDALRVLEVTAGVALIALAALLPVGLLAALAWWLAVTVQRRRRERALDTA